MSKLFLVPTPIGNLEDITFRSVRILNEADLILAEDTRNSGKLLKHYKIPTPMQSYHMHNEHKILDRLIDRMKRGNTIALISDAGTPAISDPGFLLTRACVTAKIPVECLPGATAFVPALVNSGLPNDRFVFEGFLPLKKGRQTRLKLLSHGESTILSILEFSIGVEVGQFIIVLCTLLLSFIFQTIFRFSNRDWVLVISSIILGFILPLIFMSPMFS